MMMMMMMDDDDVAHPKIGSSSAFTVRIGIWKCWFSRKGENRSTRKKPLVATERANNKFNPHIASTDLNPGGGRSVLSSLRQARSSNIPERHTR